MTAPLEELSSEALGYEHLGLCRRRIAAAILDFVGDRIDSAFAKTAALRSQQEHSIVCSEVGSLDIPKGVAIAFVIVRFVARNGDQSDGGASVADIGHRNRGLDRHHPVVGRPQHAR